MLSRWFGFRVYREEIEVVDGDSIHWRRGGWPDGAGDDGMRKIRLQGHEAPSLGSRAECRSEREAQWADAAKAFLRETIDGAGKLRLKPTGEQTRFGDEVMVLLVDGRDAAGIMIDARMAKKSAWDEDDNFIRYDWDALWDERPDALR